MATRPWVVVLRRFVRQPFPHWLALLLATGLLSLCLATPATGAQSVVDPTLDSDRDGVANSHDPDDDNDGITDDIDSAPFDPSIPGSAPTPSSIDPDADTDNDGIANSHDPDDDNDSWVDESDPVVFDSDNTIPADGTGSGTTSGGSGGTSGGARAGTTGSSTRGGVTVTSLPRTGVAPGGGGAGAVPWLLTGALISGLCGVAIRRQTRPVAVVVRPTTAGRQ